MYWYRTELDTDTGLRDTGLNSTGPIDTGRIDDGPFDTGLTNATFWYGTNLR